MKKWQLDSKKYYIFILFIIIGCKQRATIEPDKIYHVKSNKALSFMTTHIANDTLYYYDVNENELIVYDLANSNKIKRGVFSKPHMFSGFARYKNGLLLAEFVPKSRLYYWNFQNPDSLVRLNWNISEGYLVNYSAVIGAGAPLHLFHDKLYFNICRNDLALYDSIQFNASFSDYAFAFYDLKKDTTILVGCSPNQYKYKFYNDAYFHFLIKDNKLLYATSISDTIYQTSNKTIDNKFSILKKKQNLSEVPIDKLSDYEFLIKQQLNTENYFAFFYSKKAGCYVLCKRHALNQSHNNNLMTVSYKDLSWSIYLIDQQFRLIKEFIMPKKMYDFQNIFVSNGHIYISKEHELSPNFNDSLFTVEKFKINIL